MTIKFFPEHKIVATDNMTYVPYVTEDGRVGYRCEPTDGVGKSVYLYFNPSDNTDDGEPNVFVYLGEANDPSQDAPLHHYLIRDEAEAEEVVPESSVATSVFGSVHLLSGAKDKSSAYALGSQPGRYEIVKCANCDEAIEAYEPQRILKNNKHTHFDCPSERAHST
jgi:hypothetical protein